MTNEELRAWIEARLEHIGDKWDYDRYERSVRKNPNVVFYPPHEPTEEDLEMVINMRLDHHSTIEASAGFYATRRTLLKILELLND